MATETDTGGSDQQRKVLVAGAGIAAIEALLALRALATQPLALELLAPSRELVYTPLAVLEPFEPGSMRRYRLDPLLAEHGIAWHEDALAEVDPQSNRVLTSSGGEVGFGFLIICVGSRSVAAVPGALTFQPRDAAALADAIAAVERDAGGSLAFVVPPGVAWSLPAYELAFLSRRHFRARGIEVELSVITPEEAPLAVFGSEASSAVRDLLEESSIALVTRSEAERQEGGAVIDSAGERIAADRAVALPRLEGPNVGGLPSDEAGFLTVDGHCQVLETETVYAAGDVTSFPLKQGGLAAQQADVAAEAIAARLGASLEPEEFEPVLRGKLFAEERTEYLRAAIHGDRTTSKASAEPLWAPAAKVAGRYLAPQLEKLDRQS